MYEIIVTIISIMCALFCIFNDEAFLRDGQTRGIFGIYDNNGSMNILDTLTERNGWGGNPLFWDWDWD